MNLMIFISLLVYIIVWELKRAKRYPFDVMSFINIAFSIIYVATPIILIAVPGIPANSITIRENFSDTSTALILVLIAYFSLQLGWLAAPRNLHILAPAKSNLFNDKQMKRLCYLGLVVAAGAFYAYIQAYGGLLPALALGALSRFDTSVKEAMEFGESSVAVYLISIVQVVGLYSFYRVFLKKPRTDRKAFYLCAFIGSLVIMVLSAIITAGRGALLMPILYCYFAAAISGKRFYVIRFALLLVLAIPFIMVGKTLYADISALAGDRSVSSELSLLDQSTDQDDYGMIGKVAQDEAHGFISIQRALHELDRRTNYTWMSQFVSWPLQIIPRKLIGVQFEKPLGISEFNSDLLGRHGGGIPPGLIASFIYGAGMPGVILGMFFYGFVGRLLQGSMGKWLATYPGSIAIVVPLIVPYGLFVTNGDPSVFIKGAFGVLIAVFWLLLMARLKTGGNRARPVNENSSKHAGGSNEQNSQAHGGGA